MLLRLEKARAPQVVAGRMYTPWGSSGARGWDVCDTAHTGPVPQGVSNVSLTPLLSSPQPLGLPGPSGFSILADALV